MNKTNLIEDLQLIPVPPWYMTPWGILLLVLAGLTAGWLFLRWWKKRQPAPLPGVPEKGGPPIHDEYLRRLAGLRERRAKLNAYDLSIEVAEILRGYLGRRFRFAILYQTTREFLGSVSSDGKLSSHQREAVDAFLSLCDAVKFARRPASVAEQDGLLDTAERVIRECAKLS